MLTGDLLRADVSRSRVVPRLVDPRDPALLELAAELIGEVHAHVGRSRGELKSALEARARPGGAGGPEAPRATYADRVKLERGLAKLLADRSTFERGSELDPETVRAAVFARAAEARRAGTFVRETVLASAVAALSGSGSGSVTARDIEMALDADRKCRERLLAFEPLEPRALLERYDVALCQAVLLRAVRVVVSLEGRPRRLRDVLRAIKFRQLLFRADKDERGVRLELDGPLSIFESSTKYGLQLAEVLPAILLCERFALEAELAWGPKRTKRHFVLTSEDALRSTVADPGAAPPPEIEAFARHFEKTAPGWRVDANARILWLGGEAIVPDLRFVHESGRTGALELIAAARRGSLASRLALLHEHAPPGLVVAVAKGLLEDGAVLPPGVVVYRSMPSAEEVRARLELTAARA